jgi:hypothetical protein
MFVFSALVIAIETVDFHLLLIVTDYLSATFIITIAFLGIAFGSFLAFYIKAVPLPLTMIVCSAGTYAGIVFSYYSIINIGFLKYPFLLIVPFFFCAVAVSSIFAKGNSTRIYFTNLVASAAGTVIPIATVGLFKSENSFILFMLAPCVFCVILSLSIRNNFLRIPIAVLSIIAAVFTWNLFSANTSIPERISAKVFEEKILPGLGRSGDTDFDVNHPVALFKQVFKKDQVSGRYLFKGDDYDRSRAEYFLDLAGLRDRFGIDRFFRDRSEPSLRDISSIPADFFENKIIPAFRRQFSHHFRKNEDRMFLDRVYRKDPASGDYILSGDGYDRLRARYLLTSLGHIRTYDIDFDIRKSRMSSGKFKWFGGDPRILFSDDSMLGRVEYMGEEYCTEMAQGGSALDIMTDTGGPYWDTRMPHIPNPNVFIVGLSADGVCKSATILPNSKVTGIEINPGIMKTMTDNGQFARRAHYPYKGIDVHFGEGRSFLENTKETYDIITLMNIHMEYGPVSTFSPEFFHTVEGIQLLLSKLTTRGYVAFEEIIRNDRSNLFQYKLINTVKEAMRRSGIKNPEQCMHIFSWDFYPGQSLFRTITLKNTPFTREEIAEYNTGYLDELRAMPYWYDINVEYSPFMTTGHPLEKYILDPAANAPDWIPNNLPPETFSESILNKTVSPDDKHFLTSIYMPDSEGNYRAKTAQLSEEQKKRLRNILRAAGYPDGLDLSPATDDKPFPYDVFNVKNELRDIFNTTVKLCLLLLIPLAALLCFRFRKYGKPLIEQILFCACTGFGFMLVEIVLMQKFQRFIGSPMYSMIVILGGLLFFSGVGSFASSWMSRKVKIIAVALIPVILLFNVFFLDRVFFSFAEVSFTAKLWLSLAMIVPVAFLIGIPFPNALEVIKKQTTPGYAILLFGLSGAASTLASASSLIFTVHYGFSVTFIIGSLCYTAGTLLFIRIMRHA